MSTHHAIALQRNHEYVGGEALPELVRIEISLDGRASAASFERLFADIGSATTLHNLVVRQLDDELFERLLTALDRNRSITIVYLVGERADGEPTTNTQRFSFPRWRHSAQCRA